MVYFKSFHFIIGITAIMMTSPFFIMDVLDWHSYNVNEEILLGEEDKLKNLSMDFAKLAQEKTKDISLISTLKDPDKIKSYVLKLDEEGRKHGSYRINSTSYTQLDISDLLEKSQEFDKLTADTKTILSELHQNDYILYTWAITDDCVLIRSYPDMHFESLFTFDFSKIRQWCEEVKSHNFENDPDYQSPLYRSKGFPDKIVRTFLYPVVDEKNNVIGYLGIAIDWIGYYENNHLYELQMRPLIVVFKDVDNSDGTKYEPVIISADVSDRKADYESWNKNATFTKGYETQLDTNETVVTSVVFYKEFNNILVIAEIIIITIEIAVPWIAYKKKLMQMN